jgi:hypothetical protein
MTDLWFEKECRGGPSGSPLFVFGDVKGRRILRLRGANARHFAQDDKIGSNPNLYHRGHRGRSAENTEKRETTKGKNRQEKRRKKERGFFDFVAQMRGTSLRMTG